MTLLYECDFCPIEDRKAVRHNPMAPKILFAAYDSCVCQKCFEEMLVIYQERRAMGLKTVAEQDLHAMAGHADTE